MNSCRFKMLFVLIGFCSWALVACSGGFEAKRQGNTVLLPWPQSDGSYRPTAVWLETLADVQVVEGPALRVYLRPGLGDKGFSGPVMRPRLNRSSGVWLPLDVEGSLALSAYAVFERLQRFDRDLGFVDRLNWPRSLGLAMTLRTPAGMMSDNALYDSEHDVIAIAPFNGEGLSLPLNHGVLAHEHFHAHFAAAQAARGERVPGVVERIVLSGWNEGLADYYAFVFTGQTDFGRVSFGQNAVSRDLREFRAVPSARQVANWFMCEDSGACGRQVQGGPYPQEVYWIGTGIGHLLWAWGEELSKAGGHQRVLQAVLQVLPEVLMRVSSGAENSFLEPAFFFDQLLAKSSLPVTPSFCRELERSPAMASISLAERKCR